MSATATVLIPVHNGREIVLQIIGELLSKGLAVLVVDDGSTDGTAEGAQAAGAKVIRTGAKMGKGAAVRRGLRDLLDGGHRPEWVIFMDGDGQHLPSELPGFLEAMDRGVDLLLGNRWGEIQRIPGYRRIANRWGSRILYWISGQEVPDTQCGYRAIRTAVLDSIELESNGFEFETELLLKGLRAGARWRSIPVSAVYFGGPSHFRPVQDTFRLCMAGLRYAR